MNPIEQTVDNRYDAVVGQIAAIRESLDKIEENVKRLVQDEKRVLYISMPGIEGTFDGVFMVDDKGGKYEVPANYAAKSRLIVGDRLKKVEEDGKVLFKQIAKAEKKRIEAVLSKKEGKWFALCDQGTYRISDTSAEFNNASLNDKAIIIVPIDNPNAQYAALDKVLTPPSSTLRPRPIDKPVEAKKPVFKKEAGPQKPRQDAPRSDKREPRRQNKPKEFIEALVVKEEKKQVAPKAPAPISKTLTPAPAAPVAPNPAPTTPTAPTSRVTLDDDDLR